jgi:hypothetical protein
MKAFTAAVLLTVASVAHAQAKPYEQQKPGVWKDKPQGQHQQGRGRPITGVRRRPQRKC